MLSVGLDKDEDRVKIFSFSLWQWKLGIYVLFYNIFHVTQALSSTKLYGYLSPITIAKLPTEICM